MILEDVQDREPRADNTDGRKNHPGLTGIAHSRAVQEDRKNETGANGPRESWP